MELLITPAGLTRCVYGEELDLTQLGSVIIRRGSHVEPTDDGHWMVDLSPVGGRGREAFYSTCSQATAEQVLTWYAMLWSLEVTNHDSKQHLGFEEPSGWTCSSVERTAPLAMLL